MFFRVTPVTSVGRALKSRKITPRFVGPYQILQRIGDVAYQIALPPPLANIHDISIEEIYSGFVSCDPSV